MNVTLILRALGLALGIEFVSVTWALVLVAIGPTRHALAFFAADPAVFQATILDGRFGAPHLALGITKVWQPNHIYY